MFSMHKIMSHDCFNTWVDDTMSFRIPLILRKMVSYKVVEYVSFDDTIEYMYIQHADII